MPQTDSIKKMAMVGISALMISAVSHAEIVDVKWDASGNFERSQSIAPGKFVEICESLPKGSVVKWEFKASAPLNFNVHFHQGKEVFFPEKQDGVLERDGTLVAAINEDYCWMWSNKGAAPTGVRMRLAKVASKQ